MLAISDIELLREYGLRQSESAFAALVDRNIDLVYSTALRHVHNHHSAEEVTQAVFLILARKASSLRPGTILAGWLFQTTRLTAANYLRTEIRRARREQEAFMQTNLDDNQNDSWQQVVPLLNDAVGSLREKDRNAIVLRFLEGKDYKEVAAVLGGTEDAAQMRVSRALEKLRRLFSKRGVVLSAAALGGVIAAHGTQAAPAGLAVSIAASAVQGTTLAASTLSLVKGTLNLMSWTKTQFAVGAGVVLLLAYQQHESSTQARQLASARDALRAGVEAVTAQEATIAALEQQTAAIVEVRRSQESDLQQLRARRTAAANDGRADRAAGVPTTLLSATMQDPDAREYLHRQLMAECRSRYDAFIKDFKVDAQAAEKLCQQGAEQSMKNLESVAAFTEGRMTAEAAVQAEAESKQNRTNQVRELLGEVGVAKFFEYMEAYPARALVEQYDRQLVSLFSLNAEQRGRLAELFGAEPVDVMAGLSGQLTVAWLVYPEELEHRFEQQTAVNERVLRSAAAWLTPDQVELLSLLQTSNMSTQKRNILRLLRKV